MYIGCDGDRRDLRCANLIYTVAGRGFNKNKYGNHILCYSDYICGNLTKEPKSKTECSQMIKTHTSHDDIFKYLLIKHSF